MRPASALLLGILTLGIPLRVLSQIGVPTDQEAALSELDVPGGAGFRTDGLSEEPGLADPRDFTGTWNQENNAAGFLAMRAALRDAALGRLSEEEANALPSGPSLNPPGAAGQLPADAPGAGPAGPPAGGPPGDFAAGQNKKLECIPSGGPVAGGDGPVEIIQTADQLTWMAEEMHAIRRFFLKGDFTPGLAPSINGESIGHFEGDTLVVETRGMQSLPEDVRLIERISKSEEGRLLTNQVSYIHADGSPYGNPRTITLFYRPNETLLEWICEDFGEAYDPDVYVR